MPLARQQAGGGIEPDPARAREVDLRPGMQVGEVGLRARRAVERFHVGGELDQVARDEARGQAARTCLYLFERDAAVGLLRSG